MRLATFNLLHGRSPHDGAVCPGRLRDAVKALDADVLAIQEVDHTQPRSALVDQTALVAEAVGARDSRFLPALVGTPGGSWREAGPDEVPGAEPTYGIGLVSRHPVAAWHRIPLGTSRLTLPLLVDARRPALVRDEPRLGLAAVLAPPAPVGTVVATHLAFTPGYNVVQLRRLARGAAGPPRADRDPRGPQRAGPGRRRRPGSWHPLARAPTFPTEEPRIQFDHVLASTPVPVADARAVATPVSDHRALVVDLARSPRN